MNSIGWYLRLVAALFICVGLVLRYNFGLETFELRWVESGFFNWLNVSIAIRLVAFFEALVMFTLITARISKKSLLILSGCLFLIYGIDLVVGSNNLNTNAFPYFFFYTTLLSWVGLLTFVITVLLLVMQKNIDPPFVIKKWLFATVQILLWVGVFMMNHLTLDQFKSKTTSYEVGMSQWENFDQALQQQHPDFLSKEHYLVAFFSTHCEVCHWNAMKLQAAANYYGKSKQLLLVFFEPKEDITFFLDATKINAPYIELSPSIVANLVGDGFPSFVEFKKGVVSQEFSPNDLNYWELHRIFSQFP